MSGISEHLSRGRPRGEIRGFLRDSDIKELRYKDQDKTL